MGNICCGYDEEGYKHGAWYDSKDDDADAENDNGSPFNEDDDDAQYDDNATNREQLILLHEKTKSKTARRPRRTILGNDGGGFGGRGGQRRLTRIKRTSITCSPMDITPLLSYTPPSFPKSPETTDFLVNALADNFIFDSIDEETKLQFASAMQSQEFSEGDWVMRQGDEGDYFYILNEGEVAFHVGEESAESKDRDSIPPQVGTGSKGHTFGELALLYNAPRAASIRALTPLKLYKIDQLTFRSLMTSHQLKDRSNIISLVENLSVFQDLDEAKVRKLVDAFTIVEFGEGERIVNKGDHGELLYIVKSGQVKVDDIGHGNSKFQDQILEEGGCFGERALITGETRAANVTAVTPSSLLAISKPVLEEILGPLEQAIMHSCYAEYLRSVPIFEYLEPDEIDRCVRHLTCENFEKGDRICARGKLYLIEEGHALMMIPEEGENGQNENSAPEKKGVMAGPTLVKLEKGDYFGDMFGDICGSYKQENGSIPEAAPATDKMNENLINVEAKMKCLTLRGSDVQRVIGDLKRMTLFNLDAIQHVTGDLNRVTMSNLDDTATEVKQDKKKSRMSFMKSRSPADLIKSKKSNAHHRDVLNLSKLKKHRILGVGTFGKVWLVTPKSNTKDKLTPYALKMVSKRQLLHQKLTAPVLREKNVMESIEHPFLMHMVSSFQDENYLYFVMDLILGGELFELMYAADKKVNNDNKAWKESVFYQSFGAEHEKPMNGLTGVGVRAAVFYGASVIDAFAYMHSRRIVYRDLKPENILLNENGYCVVVDMGFAKVVLDKTYTVCGSLEYLAPEVIVNKGHNHVADYWSFGCLLYELIVGRTPFFKPSIDQMSLLKTIVKGQYAFPDNIAKLSPDTSNGLDQALCHWKDLISCLLKPKAVERLGNLRSGIEDILDHDWFANIDYNEFRNQSIPAPWVPEIVDPLDTSHFGNNFGKQEKPEVFSRSLSAKDQQVFSTF